MRWSVPFKLTMTYALVTSPVMFTAVGQTCDQPATHCQSRDHWNALASDGINYTLADNFSPQTDAGITEVCWWGTYLSGEQECETLEPDAFELTYYQNNDGLPGAVLAGPFQQSQGTLGVTRSIQTDDGLLDGIAEYGYHASHAAVEVNAGTCYWIEISNLHGGACEWYWSVARPADDLSAQDGALMSSDGYDESDRMTEDLAFCLDTAIGAPTYCAPVPANDGCENPTPIAEGEYLFSNIGATSVEEYTGNCYTHECCKSSLGDQVVYRDIWYEYVPPCTGMLKIDVCDSDYDSIVALHESQTVPYPCARSLSACNDDGCGDEPRDVFYPCEPYGPCVDKLCLTLVHSVAPDRCYYSHDFYEDSYCAELAYAMCRDPGGVQSELYAKVEKDWPYYIQVGGYGIDDGLDYDDRPECVSRTCALDATCCADDWDSSCDRLAWPTCTGDVGSGVLRLSLGAFPPIHQNLQDVHEFLNCFGGSCSNPPCDPPLYPEPCCLSYDFDYDGDVDVHDFTDYLAPAMTGPLEY